MRAGSDWLVEVVRWFVAPVDASGPVSPPPAPDLTGPDLTPADLVELVVRHRVVGVVAPNAARLGLDDEVAHTLTDLHRREVVKALTMMRSAVLASEALTTAGIDHLVVKGAPLAVLQGRTPTARGGGDVDLWVDRDRVRAAVATLAEAGWTWRGDGIPMSLPPGGWHARLSAWFKSEVSLRHGTALPIDLHWRLGRGWRELPLRFDEAWSRSGPATGVGPTVRTTSPVDSVRHLACHATGDVWAELRHVVDFVLTARLLGADELSALAADDRAVAIALAVCAPVAPDLAALHRPGRLVRRLGEQGWAECRSTRLQPFHRRRIRSWPERLRIAVVMRSWRLRSAPNLGAAGRALVDLVLVHRLLRLIGSRFDDRT